MDNRNKNSRIVLHEAVSTKDMKKLKSILAYDNCFNINAVSEDGSSALHLAARIGNKSMANLLLEKGANMLLKDNNGKNPLHVAAGSGNCNLVKLLIAKGMNVNIHTKCKLTPLHIAVINVNVRVAKLLILNNAKVNTRNSAGYSPLHDAVKKGSIELIKLLLDHNADPNCTNNSRDSAFHESLKTDNKSMTKLLLKHGASVQLKNDSGENALHLACKYSCEEIVKSLIDMKLNINERTHDRSTPLHYVVNSRYGREMQLTKIQLLLTNGAELEATDKRGKTPLSLAIEQGNSVSKSNNVVGCLVTMGAKMKDLEMDNLLIRAVENSSIEMCELLLEKGANVNHRRSRDGSMAIYMAIMYKRDALFDLLIANNASIHVKNEYGVTPLLGAVQIDNLYAARALLKLGANVGDITDQRVLIMAIYSESDEMVRLLLDHNVDFNGSKVLHAAAEQRNPNVMKALVERGANFDVVDEDGISVLKKAIMFDNKEVLLYLLHVGFGTSVNISNGLLHLGVDNRQPSKVVFWSTLLQHIALMQARNLHVAEQDKNLIQANAFLNACYDRYCQELENMKSQKVCEESSPSSVTYFDVLTKRHVGLARCLRSKKVRAAVSSGDHSTRFPHYADRIDYNFREGLKRLETLERCQKLLRRVFRDLVPYDITCMIAEYLPNDDFV